MIFRRPEGKEGDLGTRGCDEGLEVIAIVIKAEGIIASAFYLGPPSGVAELPRIE
jgi:hypothetical protein